MDSMHTGNQGERTRLACRPWRLAKVRQRVRRFGEHSQRAALPLLATVLLLAPATSAQEPLTLNAAVERALAQNYSIQVDSYLAPIAETLVSEAQGRFDPKLSLSFYDDTRNQPSKTDSQSGQIFQPSVFDATRIAGGIAGELPLGLTYELSGSSSNSTGNFPGAPNANFDEYNSGVAASVRLPLLRGFGKSANLARIRVARSNRDSSEWEFRATVINTVTNVIYAYNEALFAQATLRSALRSRELAARLQAENEQRNRVGAMSDYNVLSARARVATREENILIAERAVHQTENALKQLISDDHSSALLSDRLTLAQPPPPEPAFVNPAADIAEALRDRPDINQANLRLQQNIYDLSFYRNQLLPSVDLVSSYGYSGAGSDFATSRDSISRRDYPVYSAGISVSVPLTSAVERARVRNARLARQQAEIALRQLEQSIVINLDNAAGQIETAWKRVQATRTSRELSEQVLEAEVKKLRAGTGRTFDVLQLQEILSNDEVREARALAAYRNALAEYDRQLGRTLQTFQIELAERSGDL